MLEEKDYKEIANIMHIVIENEVKPRFNLLAEAIESLNEKLPPKTEIEELREEVAFLRNVVRLHAKEINELKKAQ